MKLLPVFALALLSLATFHSPAAQAQDRVECRSTGYAYSECRAPWQSAALIEQTSKTRCREGVNWGLHPSQRVLWVSEGCGGVFETRDRKTSSSSNTTKAAVIGVAAGAVLGAVLMNEHDKKKQREADAQGYRPYGDNNNAGGNGGGNGYRPYGDNNNSGGNGYRPYGDGGGTSGYSGCHGTGCLVDSPDDDDIDPRPQHDRYGNPNFDTQGNYQGCHGTGCDVDDPDEE